MERISFQDIPSGIFENLRAIENLVSTTSLDPKLLMLIKLRTAQINGCAYCVDMHYKELKHLGETELRLSSLCVWEETPYFTDYERVILCFTDELTKLDSRPINNETYNSLLKICSKEEICFFTLAISQSNTWNRLMKVFGFTPGNYELN